MLLRIKLLVRAMILARLNCHFSWPMNLGWLRVLDSLVVTHSSIHMLSLWWCRLAPASIALIWDLLSQGPFPASFIEWGHVEGLLIASRRGSTLATCCIMGTLSHHLGYVIVHMHLYVDIWRFLDWLWVPIRLLGEFSLVVYYLCIASVRRQIHLVAYYFFWVQLMEICKGFSLWVHTVLMIDELLLRAVRLALISLVSHYEKFSRIDAFSAVFWTFWLVLWNWSYRIYSLLDWRELWPIRARSNRLFYNIFTCKICPLSRAGRTLFSHEIVIGLFLACWEFQVEYFDWVRLDAWLITSPIWIFCTTVFSTLRNGCLVLALLRLHPVNMFALTQFVFR